MARQTRSQRRARREAQARSGGGDGAALERGRARQQPQPARPTAQPSTAPASAPRRGGGFIRFVQESIGELKKVEWPNQQQLIQGTVVVLIACIVVGTYLWGVDLVFKRLVENVFLGK